jgi:acetoin utilization deacetylase AcuC-like enzyme
MIKLEHIKQAIDSIALHDPEAGYVLDEMLGAGRIDIPSPDQAVTPNGDFIFLVEDRQVTVKRFLFFNEGTVPIERGLLIKYGEMMAKSTFHDQGLNLNFREAAKKTRAAGLKFMVRHEIDRAMLRLQKSREDLSKKKERSHQPSAEAGSGLMAFLEKLKSDGESGDEPETALKKDFSNSIRYQSLLRGNIPVSFTRFPFTLNTLIQIADINLEFFHVRFLLKCLAQGQRSNLFASIAAQSVTGMLFLDFKNQLFQKRIEVVYVATVMGRGEAPDSPETVAIKGAGSVLMAGAWVLWKTRYPEYREIFLDSEVAARDFYDRMGFRSRGLSEFVMGPPEPYLLKHIIRMLADGGPLAVKVSKEIKNLITRYTKVLAGKSRLPEKERYRRTAYDLIYECLRTGGGHNFTDTAVRALQRYQGKTAAVDELMKVVRAHHDDKIVNHRHRTEQVLPVVIDERFSWHLENLFHLENQKRISALNEVLKDASLYGRWESMSPRFATVEELSWVHAPAYIQKIEQSAGKQLTSFDIDTQASEKSYDTARLAVGGVFNLLDAIWKGNYARGIAFVRPPGHHAEADKAMGFCIFNNVALGARYMLNRHAAERVLIVDLDAHHGNGIQSAFYYTNRVLYISAHLFPGYPGTGMPGEVGSGIGEGYTVNIPMGKGSGDSDYARMLHFIVRPIALAYQPDIILVPLGFDLYLHDRLGGMACTPEGYAVLTAMLVEIAETVCSGRIAFVLEGGYSLKGIRECGLRVLQELCGVDTAISEKLEKAVFSDPDKLPIFNKIVQIHKKYWKFPY